MDESVKKKAEAILENQKWTVDTRLRFAREYGESCEFRE